MFHKINNVTALKDYKLSIQFAEGATKIYNLKNLCITLEDSMVRLAKKKIKKH